MPTIIDLEASGFGASSYPIEIGVALADGRTVCYLIRPQADWLHWYPAGETLHGLTRDTLLRFGKPVLEVAHSLNQLLDAQTVYSDAWGYDMAWLSRLFASAGLRQRFKLESLQSLFNEQQYGMWNQTLDDVFAECDFQRHRASNDALAIQKAFDRSAHLAQASC